MEQKVIPLDMRNTLRLADIKSRDRRFSGESITGFGELVELDVQRAIAAGDAASAAHEKRAAEARLTSPVYRELHAAVLAGITSSTARVPSYKARGDETLETTQPMADVFAEALDSADVVECLREVLAVDHPKVAALKLAIAHAWADANCEQVQEARDQEANWHGSEA